MNDKNDALIANANERHAALVSLVLSAITAITSDEPDLFANILDLAEGEKKAAEKQRRFVAARALEDMIDDLRAVRT